MDHVWLYKLINMEMQSLSVFMACGHGIVLCKWLCMPVSVYVEPWVLCGVFQAVAHLARCPWSSSQFSSNLHHCCVKKICCSSLWWEAFYLEIWSSCIPKVLKHTNLILFQFYLCLHLCVCVCVFVWVHLIQASLGGSVPVTALYFPWKTHVESFPGKPRGVRKTFGGYIGKSDRVRTYSTYGTASLDSDLQGNSARVWK